MTDVFVLLLHFISTGNIKANELMQPTSADSHKIIDITATDHKHISIMSNILTAHTLPGSDRVGCCSGIGRPTVIKALKNVACIDWRINSSLQL